MKRNSKKAGTAALTAIQPKRDYKQGIAAALPGMLSGAFLLRKTALLFGPRTAHAHSTLRTNGMRYNSLKTIGVATLHPTLDKGAKSAISGAAIAEEIVVELQTFAEIPGPDHPLPRRCPRILKPNGNTRRSILGPDIFAAIHRESPAAS